MEAIMKKQMDQSGDSMKYFIIFFFVVAVLLTSCSLRDDVTNDGIIKDSNWIYLPNGWTEIEDANNDIQSNNQIYKKISFNKQLSPYEPLAFIGEGLLTKKWVLSEDILDLRGIIQTNLLSTKNYWFLRLLREFDELVSYSEEMFRVYPEDGRISQINHYLGITDGEYIWSTLWWRHFDPTICWHEEGDIIWVNDGLQSESGNMLSFLGNRMVQKITNYNYTTSNYDTIITLFNPENGRVLNRLMCKNAFSNIYTGKSSNSILAECIRDTENQKIDYFVINFDDLTVTDVLNEEKALKFIEFEGDLFLIKSNKLFIMNEDLSSFEEIFALNEGREMINLVELYPNSKSFLLCKDLDDNSKKDTLLIWKKI